MKSEAVKYIVTHPGSAHADELWAIACVLTAHGMSPKEVVVYRREPTEDELEDPEVWVLDVGGRHEPEKHNFDHHQFERGTKECAFSLVAKYLKADGAELTFHDLLHDAPWYKSVIMLDSLGPMALAKELGLQKLPIELMSGLESGLITVIDNTSTVEPTVVLAFCVAFARKVEQACTLREALDNIEGKAKLIDIEGIRVIAYDGDQFGIAAFRDRKYPEIAVSVTRDDRGPGWSLYRFDDHPSVDFSRIAGEQGVSFAHKGGFIAKTKNITMTQALCLVKQAVQ